MKLERGHYKEPPLAEIMTCLRGCKKKLIYIHVVGKIKQKGCKTAFPDIVLGFSNFEDAREFFEKNRSLRPS